MWDVFGCQLAAFVSYRKALSILLSEFSKHLRHFADAVIQSVSRCCSVFMIKTKPSDKLKSDSNQIISVMSRPDGQDLLQGVKSSD